MARCCTYDMVRIGGCLTQVESILSVSTCALITPSNIKIINCHALEAGLQMTVFPTDN